jgi:heterodisulfide reductase subunit C1
LQNIFLFETGKKMKLYEKLLNDIRFIEGLQACINCGTCTAICPAAQFYDYDPRIIVSLVQKKDEKELEKLLKSDAIWMCGECLSCKTRCPRSNTPGYIIQSLRALSIETGYFAESEMGRQQLAVKRTVGEHILKYGYCVYLDEVNTDMYPEQGPVWNWLKDNKEQIMQRLKTQYKKEGAGTLRNTSKESLDDLQRIFDETGATARFDKIEKYSAEKAELMGLEFGEGTNDEYFKHVYNNSDLNEQER